MAENIQAGASYILKQTQLTNQKLQRATEQMVTGKRLLRPGDDIAAYAEVQQLDFAQSTEEAKLMAAQSRVSWYQTSEMYLTEVIETLTSMSETVIRARGNLASQKDIDVLDEAFQGYKKQISQIVDGLGGTSTPRATFHEKPLFVGFSPSLEIGSHISTSFDGVQDVSLYTGYGHNGFDTLPLADFNSREAVGIELSGQGGGGNFSFLILDRAASSQDDVYNGMTVTITGGAGVGESARIASYDGRSRTATFVTPLPTQLNGSSEYTLKSQGENHGLIQVEGFTEVKFAEEIWGADNDRLEVLTAGAGLFRALTEEETTYRVANGVPDSDREAKTFEEKQARRKLNIFDEEFGNLRTQKNADRMYSQVENAIRQISVFLQRHDSRAATLNSQIRDFTDRGIAEQEGSDALGKADAFKIAAEYKALSIEPQKLMTLVSRLQDNLARLNDLVHNKGVR